MTRILPNETMEAFSQKCLSLLNGHFKTYPFEKHPKAMLTILFQRGCDRILGKNFAKQRISKAKEKKLYQFINERLKACYGRWVMVDRFNIKNPYFVRFTCNLTVAFKNEWGNLYTSSSHRSLEDVFFTAHCFERVEERLPTDVFQQVSGAVIRCMKFYPLAVPTSADITFLFTEVSNREHARYNGFIYLNIRVGVLVLQDFGNLYVAKTFLSYEMAETLNLRWVSPLFDDPEKAQYPYSFYRTMREVLDLDTAAILEPTSSLVTEDYEFVDEFEEDESEEMEPV
jgi:hypothetical protein